jgi:hypothetical protein
MVAARMVGIATRKEYSAAQLKVFAIYLFLLAGLVAMGFLDGLL